MGKLNRKKIEWIIRELRKGELSIYAMAKIQHISQRWVRELHRIREELQRTPPLVLHERGKKMRARL